MAVQSRDVAATGVWLASIKPVLEVKRFRQSIEVFSAHAAAAVLDPPGSHNPSHNNWSSANARSRPAAAYPNPEAWQENVDRFFASACTSGSRSPVHSPCASPRVSKFSAGGTSDDLASVRGVRP